MSSSARAPSKPRAKRARPEHRVRVEDALEEDLFEPPRNARAEERPELVALEADAEPAALISQCFPSHAWAVRPAEGGRVAEGSDQFREDGETQEDVTAPQEGEYCFLCSADSDSEGKQMMHVRAMWAREIRTFAPNVAAARLIEYYNEVIRPYLVGTPVWTKHMVYEHFHNHEADSMTLLITQKRDLEMLRTHQVRRMYDMSTATGEAQALDPAKLKDFLSITAALQKTIEALRALEQQRR